MNSEKPQKQISEEELQSLLRTYYTPLAISESFKQSLFQELEREYRQLYRKPLPKVIWKGIFAQHRNQIIVAAALLLLVVVPLALFAPLAPENVLAQTAKVLQPVNTFHYEIRAPGVPSQPVREYWTRGSKTYFQIRRNNENEIVTEAWLDPSHFVIYELKENRVRITNPPPGLLKAIEGINKIRELNPEDWKPFPQNRIKQGGRTYQVFEMPGTGKFTDLGRAGETRMRLWIDEKTFLPAKLKGQLRPSDGGAWEPFMEIDFLWDEAEVPEDLFEPKFPDTARVDNQSQPRGSQKKVDGDTSRAAPGELIEPIVTVSHAGKPGLTLEKLWIHPAGLLIFRFNLHDKVPFGEPPHLENPEKNPWGLKPEEIPVATRGQVLFERPVETRYLGSGGMQGRWAGYRLYEFKPKADGTVPATLTFRYLLARRRLPSETSRQVYVEAVLKDPSSWELYEFSIPTENYVTARIPEEIYDSPNLNVQKTLVPTLKRILRAYEVEGNAEKALEFIRAQGWRTQDLLKEERARLEKL